MTVLLTEDVEIGWPGTGGEGNYYQVYRKRKSDDKWTPLAKVKIEGDNRGLYKFKDATAQPDGSYKYGVSIINNLGTESAITEDDLIAP